jgi:hypothetical protein
MAEQKSIRETAGVNQVVVPCPRCGEKITTVNGAVVEWIGIPDAHCACGFSGAIEWSNPRFAVSAEQVA